MGPMAFACIDEDEPSAEPNALQGIVVGCAACLPFWLGLGILTLSLG